MTWLHREDLEQLEIERLATVAAFSRESGGRRLPEPKDPVRTCFQRDRDRIIHSSAFRRLQHKTQVFAADEGDHFRSRMTHSLEVSQMARSAANALRLNADLAEAIALAHDLGHPPFGHVGEEALNELMGDDGGFRHNAQGVRIVDQLEDRHGRGYGLNLTFALRSSLLKGRIPEEFPLSPDLLPRATPPLEAKVVDRCDRIAYLCHDLDDAIHAGVVRVEEAQGLTLWQDAADRSDSPEMARVYSEIVAILMHDLVKACDESLTSSGEEPAIGLSNAMRVKSDELLTFLRERFYCSARVLDAMASGRDKIKSCFADLVKNPQTVPEMMRRRAGECSTRRLVCDYVSGMTDRFLMQQ